MWDCERYDCNLAPSMSLPKWVMAILLLIEQYTNDVYKSIDYYDIKVLYSSLPLKTFIFN